MPLILGPAGGHDLREGNNKHFATHTNGLTEEVKPSNYIYKGQLAQ